MDSDNDEYWWPSIPSSHWPYLLIYELEERTQMHNDWEQATRTPVGEFFAYSTMYKVLRFFDSIKGFYTGSLDLTGRHLPRFESLYSRWKSFLPDFKVLSSSVDSYKIEDKAGNTKTKYKVNDVCRWDGFREKWGIPPHVGYDLIAANVDILEKYINAVKVPKFQQICLLNLPLEILDMIFSFILYERDARILSSTCRTLRGIGTPYSFTRRSLVLSLVSTNIYPELNEGNKSTEEKMEIFMPGVSAQKERLLADIRFVLKNPKMLSSLRTISIGETVRLLVLSGSPELEGFLGEDFFEPLSISYSIILSQANRLRKLEIFSFDVSEDMLRAVLSLTHLSELDLIACTVHQTVLETVVAGVINPSAAMVNLHLNTGDYIWDFVTCFSNIVTIIATTHWKLPILSDLVIQNSNLFCTVRKTVFGPSLDDEDLLTLTGWINMSSAQSYLRLTHFKLSTNTWLSEMCIFQLLDALSTAPLQVLVLDGVKDGSLELLDRIAETCSQLKALTINRRENARQRKLGPATWPHATWEYASHFTGFQCLELFSWNLQVSLGYETTPASMLYLEEGFTTKEAFKQGVLAGTEPMDFYPNDSHTAYPFAAYCPTLKTFIINSGRSNDPECFCVISRLKNGAVEIKEVEAPRNSRSSELEWDTTLISIRCSQPWCPILHADE